MIVKVQLPLYTNDGKGRMLVYNQDRAIQHEAEATKLVKGAR